MIFLFSFCIPGVSVGSDEDGCLICHKYPGMVRVEKGNDKIRILHVDEAIYLSSTHGKYGCRKCHIEISQVPHTGQSGITCNGECHSDAKVKKRVKEFPLESFHADEQSYIQNLEHESSCTTCHSTYPHYEDEVIRVLLNMHTGFMQCIVCHVKRDRYSNIEFVWRKAEKVRFYGKNFGSFFNPNTGKTEESGDYITRIGAFVIDEGNSDFLNYSDDIARAEKLLLDSAISGEDKEIELKYFHRDIDKKEVSMACEECHSSKTILDFTKLGFDERKKKNLININLKGLVVKYKDFYLPMLFGD